MARLWLLSLSLLSLVVTAFAMSGDAQAGTSSLSTGTALPAKEYYRQLCQIVLHSCKYDPNLHDHITELTKLTIERDGDLNPDLIVGDGQLFLLYDRIRALPFDESVIQSALASCHAIPFASELFPKIDSATRRFLNSNSKPNMYVMRSELYEFLLRKGIEVADRYRNRPIHEDQLLDLFKASDRSDLLWDPNFLVSLLDYGIRLRLVKILQHFQVPADSLQPVLPFYRSFWPINGLSPYQSFWLTDGLADGIFHQSQLINWDFFFDLRALRDDSRTTLGQFWQIPAVDEYFRDRFVDLIPDMTRDARFPVLLRIDYPHADALFQSPHCENLIRHLRRVRFFDMLGQLLTDSAAFPHQNQIWAGMKVVLQDGRFNLYPNWVDLNSIKDRHPSLLPRLLDIMPDSLWLEAAKGTLAGRQPFRYADVVNRQYVANLMRTVGVPSSLVANRVLGLYDPKFVELQTQRLCKRPVVLAAGTRFANAVVDFVLGLPVIGRVLMAVYAPCPIPNSAARSHMERLTRAVVAAAGDDHDPGLLPSLMRKTDRNGNTILHYAFYYKQARMIDELLALPGIEMAARNNDGLAPFDFVGTWLRSDGGPITSDAVKCIEVLVCRFDVVRKFWSAAPGDAL